MNTTSTYIPIDINSLLLEFEYNSKIISSRDSNFLRVKNAFTGSINYMSFNALDYQKADTLTGNVLDKSCQQISDLSFVHFDVDRPIRYFEQRNSGLIFQSLYHEITQEILVTYNTLRIHVLSGYTFDDIAGLIARVAYIDTNFNQVFVANIAYLKEETINFHSKPFRLGDRVFDRYIEIRFPTLRSLKDIDNLIPAALKTNDTSFYYNGQFPDLQNSRVHLFLYEVNKYENDPEGQLILSTVNLPNSDSNGLFKRDLEIQDSFSDITANVQESLNGDYFELYPSYQGQFIEDFLSQRKQVYNEEYMIIHDIDVYEQLFDIAGYSETRTNSFSQIQDSGFDEPYKFRPIIENSSTAAFTIEYTVRLFNKTSPSHIIRRASISYKNPKKYGRYLEKLDIPVGFQPVRIVNKILKTTKNSNLLTNPYSVLSTGQKQSSGQIEKNIFIPFQHLNISINAKTLYMAKNELSGVDDIIQLDNSKFKLDSLIDSDVVFGQGDGRIYLSKFDNFVLFKIYKEENKKLLPYDDLSKSKDLTIYLVFEDANGEKVRIKNYYVNNALLKVTLNPGEILFKIDSITSNKILKNSDNRFWITIENTTTQTNSNVTQEFKDFETIIYTGNFYNIEDYKSLNDQEYQSKYILLDQKSNEFKLYSQEFDNVKSKIETLISDSNKVNISNSDSNLMKTYLDKLTEIIQKAGGK